MDNYYQTSGSITDKMRQLLLVMKEMNGGANNESREGDESEMTGRSNLSGAQLKQ